MLDLSLHDEQTSWNQALDGQCHVERSHRLDDDNDEDENVRSLLSQSHPSPLVHPNEYIHLIFAIYNSSTSMIFGNMLEWLDFGIYGYSEQEISQALFANNVTAGWATFGLGYACRPLGAYVLGRLADSSSRRYSFQLAIVGMACSTAGMALLPSVCGATDSTYCVVHLYKTAIPTILLRCWQGFSAGAAAGGVNVIQSEAWNSAQSVGVNNVSGAAASILSAVIVYGLRAWMGQSEYTAWGWRLAFAVVIPPSIVAAMELHSNSRDKNSQEALSVVSFAQSQSLSQHEFELSATDSCPGRDSNETKEAVTTDLDGLYHEETHRFTANDSSKLLVVVEDQDKNIIARWLLIAISVYIQFAIASYNNLNIYMVQYAREKHHMTAEEATLMAIVGKLVQLLMSPFAAAMADIFGWFAVCGVSGIGCAIIAVPVMAASQSRLLVWILVAGVLPFISTFWILNAPLLATSIFPKHYRSQGTSSVMAMGTALAGFFPLLLHQINEAADDDSDATGTSTRTHPSYSCGWILAIDAALAAAAIFWILGRAKAKQVIIYQRPDLVY